MRGSPQFGKTRAPRPTAGTDRRDGAERLGPRSARPPAAAALRAHGAAARRGPAARRPASAIVTWCVPAREAIGRPRARRAPPRLRRRAPAPRARSGGPRPACSARRPRRLSRTPTGCARRRAAARPPAAASRSIQALTATPPGRSLAQREPHDQHQRPGRGRGAERREARSRAGRHFRRARGWRRGPAGRRAGTPADARPPARARRRSARHCPRASRWVPASWRRRQRDRQDGRGARCARCAGRERGAPAGRRGRHLVSSSSVSPGLSVPRAPILTARRRCDPGHRTCAAVLTRPARGPTVADGHADDGPCPPHAPGPGGGAHRDAPDAPPSTSTRPPTSAPSIPRSTASPTRPQAQLLDLRVTAHRRGGNNTSRYNWQQNADNRGNDWYYQSIAYDSATAGDDVDDFIAETRAGNSRAHGHDPHGGLGGEAGAEPQQAGELLGREVRRADRLRLAVVPRRLQRHPGRATASSSRATTRTTRTCPRTARSTRAGSTTSSTRWGTAANGRAALLHPRQRVLDLARDPPRRAPGGRRHGRDPRQDGRLRDAHQEQRPRRAGGGARGVGLARLPAERLRPAVGGREPAVEQHARPRRPRRLGLRAVAARPDAPARGRDRTPAARRLQPALLPAGRRVRRRRLDRDAAAPEPLDAIAVGPELRGRDLDQRPRAAHPAHAGVGRAALPEHAHRHHRVQLGRRGPHQRRHHPGRRPRASSAARASTSARAGRRPTTATPTYKAIKMYRNYDGGGRHVRRRERAGHGARSRQPLGIRGPPHRGRRADRHAGGEAAVGRHRDHREPRELPGGGAGPGLAADLGERDHPSARHHRRRRRPDACRCPRRASRC